MATLHESIPPSNHAELPVTANAAPDSFKTEYHPKGGHMALYKSFSTFGQQTSSKHVPDDEPWIPFLSRADFEFAEITHAAAMSKEQVDKPIHLVRRISGGQSDFTLKSHADISKGWAHAAPQLTHFERHSVPVTHKGQDLEFKVYIQLLWDWALDLLQEPLLAPHFVWDAQQLYKHDGTDFERFIHEPWTTDHWWNIQSALPDNGVPFAFILYADKSHLSSSGKVKAYPVVARCGNLPVEIRNGDGIGGGQVVGWLPIARYHEFIGLVQ
ncbi:hypothetical protein BS17DRAFT_716720 [Gyrodon lividus]|nr:hypothetical protein BS17DRAFT_716720 [Gyrodon lividus]